MEESTAISQITKCPGKSNYSRIDNVHDAIDSLEERIPGKSLPDDRARRDSVGSIGSCVVWWRMSNEADREKDDKKIQPNCRAGKKPVAFQGPYLTKNDAAAVGS